MPSASIDTFFACALLVSVALLATGYFAGTMQTGLNDSQDANESKYLSAVAEQIVTSCGSPADWGSTGSLVPSIFGLGKSGAWMPYELDIDKISRLNDQNEYALSYYDVSKSARLNNIAFSLSISPFFSIDVELTNNETAGDATAYTFQISVSEPFGETSLQCYAVAKGFVTNVSGETSSSGVGYVNVEIPNASNGPALLIVFARASFDDRATSWAVYSFAHLSDEPTPNNSFLNLSPLNYVLNVSPKFPDTTVEGSYFFSYSCQSNLTSISENTYAIPMLMDKSPFVMVLYGSNGAADFAEWGSYPQLPNHFGADFAESEENVFTYTVTIKETLYKLTLSFGDVPE
jgi:hypothetical protein